MADEAKQLRVRVPFTTGDKAYAVGDVIKDTAAARKKLAAPIELGILVEHTEEA